jgi:tripartite-type tricarboxylate transporter receptor subunit TctC
LRKGRRILNARAEKQITAIIVGDGLLYPSGLLAVACLTIVQGGAMNRVLLAVCLVVALSSNLHGQVPFYQGKTVKFVAGYGAGSVDDMWARLIAQHMAKYTPGNPNIIVQNMGGAGSIIAANYVYNIAKPDGLTLGGVRPALYFDQLVGCKEVQFDWSKFTWVGSPTQSNQLLYMRADAPYKTIYDVRKAAEPPKCGSTGTASTSYFIAKLLEETIGAKFNVITGYRDGPEVDLAVEKGEIHCRAISIETLFAREPLSTWAKNGFVRILIQTGKKRDARLRDVPTVYEIMDELKTSESDKRLATVILASGVFGRPIVATPGIQPDRVKILQSAFTKALSDSELLTEARKRRLEIDPVGGEELEVLAREVVAQPADVVERMKKVLGN